MDPWEQPRKARKRELTDTAASASSVTNQSAPSMLKAQIAQRRSDLEKMTKSVNDLIATRDRMVAEMDRLTERHQLRSKNNLRRKIADLNVRIAKIQSGEELRDFEHTTRKYVHAMDRQQDIEVMKSRVRSIQIQEGSRDGIVDFLKSDAEPVTANIILNEFLTELKNEAPPIHIRNRDLCPTCDQPLVLLSQDSRLGCEKCGGTQQYLDATSSAMAYGEEVEFSSFSYKRINHFNEWLNQFQAKEATDIPKHVFESVAKELWKQGIRRPEDINKSKVRDALKTLKFRTYYEHSMLITVRLNGLPPPRMTPEQEERCRLMFQAIQAPFHKHCPLYRKNFLSYSYCLYKFCQLLRYNEFLPCFSLLKGKDKLWKQDRIFEKICGELGWKFIPSTGVADAQDYTSSKTGQTKGTVRSSRKNTLDLFDD